MNGWMNEGVNEWQQKNMECTASVWDSEIPLTDYLKGKYVYVYQCFIYTK